MSRADEGFNKCVATIEYNEYVVDIEDAKHLLIIAARSERYKASGGYGDNPLKVSIDDLSPLSVSVKSLSRAQYVQGKLTADTDTKS